MGNRYSYYFDIYLNNLNIIRKATFIDSYTVAQLTTDVNWMVNVGPESDVTLFLKLGRVGQNIICDNPSILYADSLNSIQFDESIHGQNYAESQDFAQGIAEAYEYGQVPQGNHESSGVNKPHHDHIFNHHDHQHHIHH